MESNIITPNNYYRRITNMKSSICIAAILALVFVSTAAGQARLRAEVPERFTLALTTEQKEFAIDLKDGELCDLSTDATDEMPLMVSLISPSGEALIKDGTLSGGYVFVAGETGAYRLVFKVQQNLPDDITAKLIGKTVTVRYTNRFTLPKRSVTKAVRDVNGYQAKIVEEPGEEGNAYFVVQKGNKILAIWRQEKVISGGMHFADDASQAYGPEEKKSATLYRTTVDKTGDGTPDIAVEDYSGGAHCCYRMTFVELGDRVRQLPTIDTANDRLTAVAKRPGGGLRFEAAEQAFAYWAIAFAFSPFPIIIYEFDKQDNFVPRFDVMRKPAPSLAVLKARAAKARAKINLNEWTSPDDNFNDFDEAFWGEMLDLIYTGHENLAWRYFDMVWPAKKKGKAKFLADFKEQLAMTAYGEWKRSTPR
jgi:hypothetical protein